MGDMSSVCLEMEIAQHCHEATTEPSHLRERLTCFIGVSRAGLPLSSAVAFALRGSYLLSNELQIVKPLTMFILVLDISQALQRVGSISLPHPHGLSSKKQRKLVLLHQDV